MIDKDYRMAVLVNTSTLPNDTIFIWDTPSDPAAYGTGSIWGYLHIYWGNLINNRADVPGFPLKVGDVKKLSMDFDFEKLYGKDDYKIALNNFFTKDSTLKPVKEKAGDFFFVFDQVGTYMPKYQVTMPNITLGGSPFAVLYTKDEHIEQESRRIIIKDGRQWLKGTLDLLSMYKLYIDQSYLDPNQYIPNIQIGVEVTEGFTAVKVNKWDIQME